MFEGAELGQRLTKGEYEARVPTLRERLLDAQFQLRTAGFSVIIVIGGVEGAGKGETVNRLLEWLDSRGIATFALNRPSDEECQRPRFYQFWRRLPRKGSIGIFFGSWYTAPIVDFAFGLSDEAKFDFELGRIVDFEQMLASEGTLVLKFWLHLTKKQQRRRFKKLAHDPQKAWRVTRRDWKFHARYDEFLPISARALRRTSTAAAPWDIVEARDRRFREITVAERICTALESRLASSVGFVAADGPPQDLPLTTSRNLLNQLDLNQSLSPTDYAQALAKSQAVIGRLSRTLRDERRAVVVVFEGSDASGKGGCIRRITQALDARFYRVIPIAAPTDEERAQPYLWRFWRHLPAHGEYAIFDRSWYGRVLVERVESFCPPADWRRAYTEINAFEEQLIDAGVLLFKFWLAISPGEQVRRFEAREATGYKRYKLTDEDRRNQVKAPDYDVAACEMFARTSTELAPWTLVEANDKHFARVKVLRTIGEGLQRVGHQR